MTFRDLLASLRSYWQGPWGSGDRALASIFGGQPVAAGVTVNEHTALNFSAVWAAVQAISSASSALPLVFYKRNGPDRKEAYLDHPNFWLMHHQSNPEMSAQVFRETLTAHALTWGNGYGEIRLDAAGRPGALWPLLPSHTYPFRAENGRIRYRVTGDDGTTRDLAAEEVIHLRGLGYDGLCGYSVLQRARQTIGLGLAAESFGAKLFGNGSHYSLLIKHPGKLSENAHQRLKEEMKAKPAHEIAIIEEGMDIEKLTIPPDDAQFLETRLFQVEEICRWFNISPIELHDLSRATFSNVEQLSINFLTRTLTPWLVRWEKELDRKLISPLEKRQQFFKHNVNGILRGDVQARGQWYGLMRQWGVFSVNDIRRLEDMDSIGPEGDVYLTPLNMVPADRADEVVPAKPAAPTPAPEKPAPAEESSRAIADVTQQLAQIGVDLNAMRSGTDERLQVLAAQLARRDMPTPGADESEDAFVARCMASDMMQEEFPDEAQRAAVCHQQFGARAIRLELEALRDQVATLADARADQAAPESLANALQQVAEERAATMAARLAAVVPAVRALIEDSARVLVRREADRVRRAVHAGGAREQVASRITMLYLKHIDHSVKVLRGVMQVHAHLVGYAGDLEVWLQELASGRAKQSMDEVAVILSDPQQDLGDAIDGLTARWEAERPQALADACLEEVLRHA